MPRVADYVIISDAKFKILSLIADLPTELAKTFSFDLEEGASLGSRSILSFVLFVNATDSKGFRVEINGSEQVKFAFSGPSFHAITEVIAADLLKEKNNKIRVIADSPLGEGSLDFGDLVLFYQRNI